ncbi:MAG: shikimate dehydrogenase [bacterium]
MKALSGHTRPYAVLGHPIGHTLSPVMHNAALESLGMDAIYLAFDVAPDQLMTVLPAMKAMGFGGVNLTVPLKEVAFKGLSDLDESARRLGAVNTVEFTPNGMRGHNTDGKGFLTAIREAFGFSVKGQSLFMLGCGGAGRAVAITAAGEGARRLILADLDESRCRAIARDVAVLAPSTQVELAGVTPEEWMRKTPDAGLIVQASPIGMKAGDVCPLAPSAFRADQLAFDLVYNRPETCFTKAAAAGGAKAVNGLGMLLHQGAEAFTIWTGKPAAVEVMRKALEQALYSS